MFIVTTKISKGKAAAILIGICVILAACIILVSMARGRAADAAAMTGSQQIEVSYKNIRENADRVTFLNAFGWEVAEEPVSIEEITIPKEFNEIYEAYNRMQKEQALDLSRYRGKTLRRYTYQVRNYPDRDDPIWANLLIYKNRVIAGDICSSEFHGFMHGFQMP